MNHAANDSHSDRARKWAWFLTIVLAVAMVVSIIDRFALSLLIEPIKHTYSVSDTQIGLLQGLAFGMFYAVLGLPCGWLADRWSRKGTIVLGLAIWSVATAACGLATGFAGLLMARMLVGAGEAALAPAAYAIIHDQFPKTMINRALSVFQVGAVIGAGSAFYIVGGMYDYLKGLGPLTFPSIGTLQPWQTTFVAVAVPGVVLIPLLWLVLSRTQRAAEQREHASAKTTPDAQHLSTARYMHADWKFITSLFVGMSGLLTMNYALLSWVPSIFAREFGWTPGQIGRPYGLIVLAASSLGMMIGGWAADRIQRNQSELSALKVPLTAAALALPIALSGFVINTPIGLLACTAVLHALCTCAIGVAPALIQLRTPAPIRSRVSSVYVLAVNICGLAAGPILVGQVTGLVAPGPTALRTSVFIVGGTALLIALLALGKHVLAPREKVVGAVL